MASAPRLVRSAAKSLWPSGRSTTGLTVDHDVVRRQGSNCLGDPGQLSGEVGSVPAPQRDPAGLLTDEQPVAVMLDFVDPVRAGRRLGDQRRLGRKDETGRRAQLNCTAE